MSNPTAHSIVLKYLFYYQKEPGLLEEMAGLRSETGNTQDETYQKGRKLSKIIGSPVKRTEERKRTRDSHYPETI